MGQRDGRKKNSPVIFYKQQGETFADIGVNQGLNKDDFAVVFQTPIQAEVLHLCGNKKVVCIDSLMVLMDKILN